MKRVLHQFHHSWVNFVFIEKPSEVKSLDDLFDLFCVFVNHDEKKRYFNIQVSVNVNLCRKVALETAVERVWDAFEACYRSKEFSTKFGKCELAVREYEELAAVIKRLKSNFARIITAAKIPSAVRALTFPNNRRNSQVGMVSIDVRLQRYINIKCIPANAPKEEQKSDKPWGQTKIGHCLFNVYVFIPRVVMNCRLLQLDVLQREFENEVREAFALLPYIWINFNEYAEKQLENPDESTTEEPVTE